MLARGHSTPLMTQGPLLTREFNVLRDRVERDLQDDSLGMTFLMHEYNVFLGLKVAQRDLRARLLSPSPRIDHVWHQHILDTEAYAAFCGRVLGEDGLLLHHNPDAALNTSARDQRYLWTYVSLPEASRALGAIWPMPEALTNMAHEERKGAAEVPKAPKPHAARVLFPQTAEHGHTIDDKQNIARALDVKMTELEMQLHGLKRPAPDVKMAELEMQLHGLKRPAPDAASGGDKKRTKRLKGVMVRAFDPDEPVTLRVISLTGQRCTVETTMSSPASMLFERICEQTGIPVAQQVLLCNHQRIKHDTPLRVRDLNVTDGDLLRMMLNLDGC